MWQRTPHFDVRVPSIGSRFIDIAIDEAVGLDVRISMAGDAEPGDLIGVGREDVAPAAGSSIRAVAGSVASGRVMASIIGIVAASGGSIGDGVVVSDSIVPGGDDADIEVDSNDVSALRPGGFSVDSNAVLFDGTEPLAILEAVFHADAVFDLSDAEDSDVEVAHDDEEKVISSRATLNGAGQVMRIWYPVWVPGDFGSTNVGSVAPVFSVRHRGTGGAEIVMRFIDSAGVPHAGEAVPCPSDFALASLMRSDLALATIQPGSLCWFVVEATGEDKDEFEVERIVRMRYQPARSFG